MGSLQVVVEVVEAEYHNYERTHLVLQQKEMLVLVEDHSNLNLIFQPDYCLAAIEVEVVQARADDSCCIDCNS